MDKWEANESKDYLGVFSFQLWTEFKLPEVYKKKVVAKSIVCYTQDVILYSVMKDIGPPWWLKQ